MRKSVGVVLCSVVFATAACRTATPDRGERHLVELNRHLFERLLQRDPRPYLDIALPEYLFVASIGIVEDKEAVTSNPEYLSIEQVTITNEEFRRVGDTAVLVGMMHVRGTVLGFPLPEQMRYLSIFVQTEGRWRLLAQSLTPLSDPRDGPDDGEDTVTPRGRPDSIPPRLDDEARSR